MVKLYFLILLFPFICQGQIINKKSIANGKALTNTSIKIIWRDGEYGADLFLNTGYFDTIKDPERAAIAYVATFVGSECEWDGKANDSFSNLNCKVIAALGLGYQCSATHLQFLRNWFRNDKSFLKELKNCPETPFTATHQNTFTYLFLKTVGDKITVNYKAGWTSGPSGKDGEWTERIVFKINKDELLLLSKKTTNL